MRADGGHQRRVTQGQAEESFASFSPGGHRILMVHNGHIAIARSDGTGVKELTTGHRATEPAFSPDGRRIVFKKLPKFHPTEIWVMRRDGTDKRLLARASADAEVEYESPDFSPDGSHVLFERLECSSHTCDSSDILMRSNGRHKRVVGGGETPAFSPDGRRIAAVVQSCDALTLTCDPATIVTFGRTGSEVRTVARADDPNAFGSIGAPSWQPIPAR